MFWAKFYFKNVTILYICKTVCTYVYVGLPEGKPWKTKKGTAAHVVVVAPRCFELFEHHLPEVAVASHPKTNDS